jgi:tRNA nucleotidyltransferase/poly(A) polymerase
MPIKFNKALLFCEVSFRKILATLTKHEESLYSGLPAQFAFDYPKIKDSPNDLECDEVCQFFHKLVVLINKSIFIKKSLSEKSKIDITKENIELAFIKKELTEYTLYLIKKRPLLWSYILSRPAGRHGLYYLLYISIVNKEVWQKPEIFFTWLKALEDTSQDLDEKNILHFLSILHIDVWTAVEDLSSIYCADSIVQTGNPFVTINLILRTPPQLNVQELELEVLNGILSQPLTYPEKCPKFLINFIRINYGFNTINKILGLKLPGNALFDMIQRIHLPSYFPNSSPKSINTQAPESIFQLIYLTYQTMRIHARLFCLSIDQELIFKKWHSILLFKLIQLYHLIHPIIPISAETLLMLAECVSELIETQAYQASRSVFQNEKDFWYTVAIIFNFRGYVKVEFVDLLNKNINIILDNLLRFNHIEEAVFILGSYIELEHLKSASFRSSYKAYKSLFQLLKLCCLMPSLKDRDETGLILEITEDHFYEFLDIISDIKIDLSTLRRDFILGSFQLLPCILRQYIMKSIHGLSEHIQIEQLNNLHFKNLHKAQGLFLEIMHLLNASSTEISQLSQALKEKECQELHLNELLKETFEKAPNFELKTKTKARVFKPVELEMSKFDSQTLFNSSPHFCDQSLLPKGLLKLAKDIKEHLGSTLILTGGAVTNLLLNRPNPNDYDCLIFNVELSVLCETLTNLNYPKPRIVGANYPVLKLKFHDGEQSIEIDFGTYSSQDPNLHSNMIKILKKRDFKLCALYIELKDAALLEIKGYGRAIRSVHLKQVSIVDNKQDVFKEDPIRFLRLTKIKCQYPDFSNDSFLNHVLKHTCLKTCFEQFLKTELNQFRLGTSLEQLFMRFEVSKVIDEMGRLGLIEAMTNIPYHKIQPHLHLLERYCTNQIKKRVQIHKYPQELKHDEEDFLRNLRAYEIKLCFYHFILSIYCLNNPSESIKSWIFNQVMRKINPIQLDYLDFIQQTHWKLPQSCMVFDEHLNQLTEQLKIEFDQLHTSSTVLSCK